MLVGAGWVRWVRHGNGSSFTGLDLADELRHGVVTPSWGPAAGAAIYAVVAVGAASAASIPVRRPAAVLVRVCMCAAIVAVLAYLAAASGFPVGNWALGPFMALFGAAATATISAAQIRDRVAAANELEVIP